MTSVLFDVNSPAIIPCNFEVCCCFLIRISDLTIQIPPSQCEPFQVEVSLGISQPFQSPGVPYSKVVPCAVMLQVLDLLPLVTITENS